MTSIWLCDDHALLRGAMRQLLAMDFPEADFGEFGAGADLLAAIATPPDALLLDLDLNDALCGQPLIQLLLVKMPALQILVVTMHGRRDVVELCRRNGASGFVSKGASPHRLAEAVTRMLAGANAFLDPNSDCWMDASMPTHRRAALSDREFLVVQGLRDGKSLRTIAHELGISASAVGTYKRRLCDKLAVRSDAELFRQIERGFGYVL